MKNCTEKGLEVALDLPNQVEFNRKRNLIQDKKLETLSSQINQLLEQAPAGFLPRVYYGLQQGAATYRFLENSTISQSLAGNIGDAFSLNSPQEIDDYISAVAVKVDEETLQVIIQGDYTLNTTSFSALNMRTGEATEITIENALVLQFASYLGNYPAINNKEKQITVLKSIEFNKTNAVFASVDYSSDGIYNWVIIGGYVNGKDGKAIYSITQSTYNTIISIVQEGDMLLSIGTFIEGTIEFGNYNLYSVDAINPLSVTLLGNIKGETGAQGVQGVQGLPGEQGLTPTIQDGFWYIGEVNTGVKAVGIDGTNGQDGKSFNIQSGLYSTIDNYGKPNNVTPEGEALLQLPTLPQSDISGKGYVVFDPLTTPLEPFNDLYWANNGDEKWTIIHPFAGLNGKDGTNGATPYIQDNNWFINGVNTGVQATGDAGAQGEQGVGVSDIEITPKASEDGGNAYDMNVTLTNGEVVFAGDFSAPRGLPGERGLTFAQVNNINDRQVDDYTVSTIQPVLTDGTELPAVDIRAKNGVINYEMLLNFIYPIGSYFMNESEEFDSVEKVQAHFGGTWEKLEDGTFLEAGSTIENKEAGLPNITGQTEKVSYQPTLNQNSATGALSLSSSLDYITRVGSGDSISYVMYRLFFNASNSNNIYGKSNTVQPKSRTIYIYKRIS